MLDLATGHSAKTVRWKNVQMKWVDLVAKLAKPYKTAETLKAFLGATKDEQSSIKDVGGYVGGYLREGKRSPQNVLHRQILTLDVDFATMDFLDLYDVLVGYEAVIHGTHKHCTTNPRFRLIIPVNRPLNVVEYEAVARKVASKIGIDLFDPTTFEVNRLMFWQSTPVDQEYYFRHFKSEILDADEILAEYVDYTDSSSWATSKVYDKTTKDLADKQEDPTTKRGVIGAFCRAYDIHEGIETFLSDKYERIGDSERYTYTGGSTAGGLVTYNDLFAYSHHGTDPISGKMCNIYDLVRIHKFGHLDEGTSTKNSIRKMEELICADVNVKDAIYTGKQLSAKEEFSDYIEEDDNYEESEPLDEATGLEDEEEDTEWVRDLDIDAKGNYLSSASNINRILKHDKHLKGAFKFNVFNSKRYVCKSMPWRKVKRPEPIRDVDYAGIRNYLECIYGIANVSKVDDALSILFERNAFNPVRDYLVGLEWDGVQRVDSLLIDYFGQEDNAYTREAIKVFMVAAVARILNSGCKYELVLTLVGGEGIGKSTFFRKLGGAFFSDSFNTIHGNAAFEQLQGAWIVEMAELSGLKKAEVEAVKQYVSKQEDTYRPAYGRTVETFPRVCVFGATTNVSDFLRSANGNRRFMPIACKLGIKQVWDGSLDDDRDQLWAEAVCLFKDGANLYLSKEANDIANLAREAHQEVDERKGLILDYLATNVTEDWDTMSCMQRELFYSDGSQGNVERTTVCVAEIWRECLGKSKADMNAYNTKEINSIMRSLPDWEFVNSTKRFGTYGVQKYYVRKSD